MTDYAAATDRSTPGFRRHRVGEWVLRTSSGATGRANSATLHGDPGVPIAAAVDEVVAWYAEQGGSTQVMVWDDTPAEVVAELSRRGLAGGRPTQVMDAPLAQVLERLAPVPRLRGRIESEPPVLLQEMVSPERLAEITHTDLERRFGVVAADDVDIATGMVVLDGPLIGIFAMRTREERQGQGAGRAVIQTMLEGAAAAGCDTAWLQVEADNLRANQWYARLGFVIRTRYDYWSAPFISISPVRRDDDTDAGRDSGA